MVVEHRLPALAIECRCNSLQKLRSQLLCRPFQSTALLLVKTGSYRVKGLRLCLGFDCSSIIGYGYQSS